MGIDIHVFNLLKWSLEKHGQFGKVVTIGRQGLNIPYEKLKRIVSLPNDYVQTQFCEELLKKIFGADCVDSIDNSDFEGCTYVMDLNHPVELTRQYDTIIDAGCLEHIFNIPQALSNVSELCAEGGQILHVLPCNNFCGHGFWQISPELFFSLYSEENGYAETQVFVVDYFYPDVWYEVIPPQDGRRALILSETELYVMCRTVKKKHIAIKHVQQSDYVYQWEKGATKKQVSVRHRLLEGLRAAISTPTLLRLITFIIPMRRLRSRNYGLSAANPFLIKRRVSDLFSKTSL